MRSALVLFLLLIVMFLPGAWAQEDLDFSLDHDGQDWVFSPHHEQVSGILEEEGPGEHVQWRITVGPGHDRLFGEVNVPEGYFDVQRARQVVPESQEGLFVEVNSPETVDQAVNPARVLNITTPDDGFFSYRFSFPAVTDSNETMFSLTRDVGPPEFAVGSVQNVTHRGFFVATETSEPAWGVLWVRPADAGPEDAVEHPTQTPALVQRFPIVGLQPETEYVFHVEFRDWAGNRAASGQFDLTTGPRVVGESPRILSVSPAPDAVLSSSPQVVEATFEPVAGQVTRTGVRLFVDLQEVSSHVFVEGDRLEYAPVEPFDPGQHVVRLELMNTEGGEAAQRWEFTVDESNDSGSPVAAVFLVSLVGLVWTTARLRR